MQRHLRLLLILILPFSSAVFAQKAPWAISVGDFLDQKAYNLATDKDGNSIIAGSFKGTDVDFDPSPTGTALMTSTGDNDIFVAKYNSAGQYVWAFKIGGAGNDAAEYVKVDALGNVFISGWFRGSNVDFDPGSGTAMLTSNGDQGQDRGFAGDAYLAKYDRNGNYEWAFNVGSSDILDFGDAMFIDENGDVYWTGGFTGTNVDFDPSPASHTLDCLGVTSLFLAKYTSAGQYVWAVPFTGSTVVNAAGRSIAVDKNKNIYLAANFDGTIDIDPSPSATHNLTTNGCSDWFLLKLDSSANYVWGFAAGGAGCDYAWSLALDTSSNIYVTGFFASYDIDFDPDANTTNSRATYGGFDAFVAEYDQNGHHIYAHTFGSTADDMCFGITLNETGYSLMGSFSETTDFDGSTGVYNLTSEGGTDGFVARYDRTGKFQTAFRLGGGGDDIVRGVSSYFDSFAPRVSSYPYGESMYVTGYFSSVNVDFDPSSSKLMLSSQGGNDIFLAKYSDIEAVNMIRGSVYLDKNGNNIKDANEPLFNQAEIFSYKPNADTIVSVSSNGQFGFAIDTGTYVTSASCYRPYYSVSSQNHITNFNSYGNTDSLLFAVHAIPGRRDLFTTLISLNTLRPGFPAYYKLMYSNNGTDTVASGYLQYIKDSRLNFIASSPMPASVSGDTLRWNYSNLKPGDTTSIYLEFQVASPPTAQINDTIVNGVTIYPIATDLTPEDNRSSVARIVVGSFDPNDKTEKHGGHIKSTELADGYLQYMIRFQNTGTDTAFNIILRDTLTTNLNWNSLEMLTASHPYKLIIKDGRFCEWKFNDIKLVDSFKNEKLSHGYIVFRIKARQGLAVGDTIKNRASIYFDYNPPVRTNINYTVVDRSALPVKLINFTAVREIKSNKLNWSTAGEVNTKYFQIERSATGVNFLPIGKINADGNSINSKSYVFNDFAPIQGTNYYRLRIVDNDGSTEFSPIRKLNNSSTFDISIYPNPVKNQVNVKYESDKDVLVDAVITDASGKTISMHKWNATAGSGARAVDISKLPTGSYYLKVNAGEERFVIKFQKL